MDRVTIYPGAIPLETDLLSTNKNTMIAISKLSAAVLGTSTIANGFAVTPTGPASLQVVAAPGEIYSLVNIDSTAYSSLLADTAHQITKQGILLDPTTLNCPAPSTSGQSINYLVQVTYQDLDSNPVVLPYYNASNPSQAYSGPANTGVAQNTSRKGVAVVQVKAGASATTGSQVTPAPDAGYIGLYVVTVAYGQTTITSTSISQYASAPLLPSGILQSVQNGNASFAIDTGTANTYVCNFTPALTSRSEGQSLRFKVKTANNGACTINDGLGAVPLVGGAHAALQGGELIANGDAWIEWNSSIGSGSYILLFCTGGAEQVAPATKTQHAVQQSQLGNFNGITFTGTSTVLTAAFTGKTLVVNTSGTTQTLPAAASLQLGSTITIGAYGACTIKGNAAELISNPFGVSANTLIINAGEEIQLTTDGTGWYTSAYSQAVVGTPVGSMRNAKISVVAASATATFTADEVAVKTALGGQAWLLSNFSKTINLATTGVGAMDTGTAPVSGYVAIYAIYNPTTGVSALLAKDATSAVAAEVYAGGSMPAGYTASALVSVWRTTAASLLDAGYQADRYISIVTKQVLSTTTPQASYTALSIASAVPPNAKSCRGWSVITNSAAGANIYGAIASSTTGIGSLAANANPVGNVNGGIQAPFPDILLITSQTLFYTATTSSGTMTYVIDVAGYSI